MRTGVFFLALLTALPAQEPSYEAVIQKWRQDRLARLKADDGWLIVAGLFWLKSGNSTAGASATNDIVLPLGAPERVGTFILKDGKTQFIADSGADVTVNGKPVRTLEMRPDTQGKPDVIATGDLSMFVIQRGARYAIRLRDKNSKFRREFTGLTWFPIDESYRIRARFVRYDPPRQIAVPNVLGETEQSPCPGYAVFDLGGKQLRLEPVLEDDRLFFIFRDLTTGKETYPAGRFLYADMPKDETVILDFNEAYNPPCAFTPYATCPLPPKQNHLPVRIPAGEKTYHH